MAALVVVGKKNDWLYEAVIVFFRQEIVEIVIPRDIEVICDCPVHVVSQLINVVQYHVRVVKGRRVALGICREKLLVKLRLKRR